MVEIREMSYPANVTLLPGATQHWSDLDRLGTAWAVAERVIAPQLAGRLLVVGAVPIEVLKRWATAGPVDVCVRSIPDAAAIGTALADARVWCGDVAALPAEASGYDVVVCADAAAVLPLESEARPWASVVDAARSRLADGGRAVLFVQNDLGLHRLTAGHDPIKENSDADWSVLSTWDATRPRTAAQLADALPGATAWELWPGWPDVRLARRLGAGVPDALVGALALQVALEPFRGPDPSWLLQSAQQAGRLGDVASGWLAVTNARPEDAALLAVTREDGPVVDLTGTEAAAGARSLAGLIADAAAMHDLPRLRRLLTAWQDALAASAVGGVVTADPRVGLFLATEDADGVRVASLAEAGHGETVENAQWAGVGDLVAVVRGRAWRTPWPATTSDADLVALIGTMGGLPDPDPDTVARALRALKPTGDPFEKQTRQQLIAAIDRNNETIRTLRSRVNWNELQFVSHKAEVRLKAEAAKAKGRARRVVTEVRQPARLAGKVARKARGVLKRS